MFFLKLASAASLLACAIAAPNAKLSRKSEGIHLVNCGSQYSAVVYCSNDSDCDFAPSTDNECIPGGEAGIHTWEGSEQSCTFPTGTKFSWDILANAQLDPDYSDVGTGSNGYTSFNIFKDNQHVMFNDGYGYECKSIYYALDA